MDPKLIQPIEAIPDYLESTTCLDPIVIKTHSSCYCLEGWKMAQEALTAEKNIRCHVSYVQDISEVELALCKAGSRNLDRKTPSEN